MPRKDSAPEVRLRRALHNLGLRFRVQGKLPGRPDIVFSKARIAVFVDRCFWHRCPEHSTIPKNNHEWWREKLSTNVTRDRRKDTELEALGWLPVHIWEHEDPRAAALRIRELWTEVQAELQFRSLLHGARLSQATQLVPMSRMSVFTCSPNLKGDD